jgi:hypothetical protein
LTIKVGSFKNYIFFGEGIIALLRAKAGIADRPIYSARYTPAEYQVVAISIIVLKKL